MIWNIFPHAQMPSIYRYAKIFGPLINWVVLLISFKILCIFWIRVLYQMCLFKIFSSSLWHASFIYFYFFDIVLLQIRGLVFFLGGGLFFWFLSFYGYTSGTWKFPGCGLNRSCCSCQPQPQPQQHHIRATSATYPQPVARPDP